MRELKKQLRNTLLSICPNVYAFEKAPADGPVPYLTYDLSQGTNIEDQIVWIVDIDIWDKNINEINVDDLVKKLKKLNRFNFINDKIQFSMHLDRIINTKSESLDWKRKTIVFNIRYYDMEV